MTTGVTVKAYLQRQSEPDYEIRRFTLEENVSTSFDYLKGKLATLFSGLSNGEFNVTWKGK